MSRVHDIPREPRAPSGHSWPLLQREQGDDIMATCLLGSSHKNDRFCVAKISSCFTKRLLIWQIFSCDILSINFAVHFHFILRYKRLNSRRMWLTLNVRCFLLETIFLLWIPDLFFQFFIFPRPWLRRHSLKRICLVNVSICQNTLSKEEASL